MNATAQAKLAIRATERAAQSVAEQTEESVAGTEQAVYAATRSSISATKASILAVARATEAALPTPALIVARGDYQQRGDVATIGVARVADRSDELGEPKPVAELPFFNSVFEHDVNPSAGVAVWVGGGDPNAPAVPGRPEDGGLWAYRPSEAPRLLVAVPQGDFLEAPRISADGKWVAYALHHYSGADEERTEIRVAAVDGSSDRQRAGGVEEHAERGFRLAPLAWVLGDAKLLLESTQDSEGTPRGLRQLDVATGEITRARTPDETLWNPTVDPAHTRVAYTTFEWLESDEGFVPSPPFRLKVLDVVTGEAVTLLENDEHRFGAPVWSPEGGRLMVPVIGSAADESVLAVHVATGESLPIRVWSGWNPQPRPDARGLASAPVPVAWLPGEVVVFSDGDTAVQLVDLDEATSDSEGHSTAPSWTLAGTPPPAVTVLGYVAPGNDPQGAVILPEAGRSQGPDGWYARVLAGDSDGPLWRSVLEVVGPAGQQWTAMDEYVPGAICGVNMSVFGWPADGTVLFGRPDCGDGCWRFGGPWDAYRMSLASGAIEPLEGDDFALAPDGLTLAAYPDQSGASAGITVTLLTLSTRTSVEAVLPASDDPEGWPAWSPFQWSPDSKYVAVAEVLGGCPAEETSTLYVVRASDGEIVLRRQFDEPRFPASWDDSSHVRLAGLLGGLPEGTVEPGPDRIIQVP